MTKPEKKSVVINFTGNGRGKSSAAYGILMRHIGYGKRAAVVEFIKDGCSGEVEFMRKQEQIKLFCNGCGFTWNNSDEENTSCAKAAWQQAKNILNEGQESLLILDEFNHVLHENLIPLAEAIEVIQQRRDDLNVVITGRNAPEELLDICDCVSDICDRKHYFRQGVEALTGIDY